MQKYRKRFKFSTASKQKELTEKEQQQFIDKIIRSVDSNSELDRGDFPAIILRELPHSKTDIYGQRFDVVGNDRYIEVLQKFLASDLSIPLSLQDCPLFKDYDPSKPYCKYDKGKEIYGQFSLLPVEVRRYIWDVKYPVEIRGYGDEVP
jgi:hypothetical protein